MKKNRNIKAYIWSLFTSLRLTIGLLIGLAIVCIIGTVIPQGETPAKYLNLYGARLYSWFLTLEITDMYHAWWFVTMLAMLAVNIIACTIKRLPAKLKLVGEQKEVTLQFVKSRSNKAIIEGLNTKPEDVEEKLKGFLKKRRYNCKVSKSEDGITFTAEKGKWARFGADMVHTGLIVILIGVLIGVTIGFKDFRAIDEGDISNIPKADFQLKLNKHWMTYWDHKDTIDVHPKDIHGFMISMPECTESKAKINVNGEVKEVEVGQTAKFKNLEVVLNSISDKGIAKITIPGHGSVKQHYSDLTVIEDGKEVLNKVIWVNNPLDYKGYRFFQSSCGQSPTKIRHTHLRPYDMKTKKFLSDEITLEWKQKVKIPGTEYEVAPVGFVGDFVYDNKTRKVGFRSWDHKNPAVQLAVYKDGKFVHTAWSFKNKHGFMPIFGKEAKYNVVFTNYCATKYSGLRIAKDPGVKVVWLGCSIMFLGFIFAFFMFHKRLWIKVVSKDGSVDVLIAGSINKNKKVFKNEFTQLTDSLKESFKD